MKLYHWLMLIFCLLSCDPINDMTYKISNTTDQNLKVYFHSRVDIFNDTLELSKKSVKIWRVETDPGSPSKIPLEVDYDSIRVESQSTFVVKYTPQTSGKTIFDYNFWIENKKGKRDYEYTFEITQEDVSPNEGG